MTSTEPSQPAQSRSRAYTHVLSKTTYMRGCQCAKSLSLYTHRRELMPPVPAAQQAVFDAGTEVGLLAQQLFPGGLDVRPQSARDFTESLSRTAQAIADGVTVLYEAAFVHDDVLVAVDILQRDGDSWRAYEVKGTGSVKPPHIEDAALQFHVMSAAGLSVSDISIVHLNTDYVRAGALDLSRLFTVSSVFDRVQSVLHGVPDRIAGLKPVVLSSDEPVVAIGSQCNVPYPCAFKTYCWRDVPAATRGPARVEPAPLREFLDALQYPLSFMDFETFSTSIPVFDGTWPFCQVPFQFSVHGQSARGADVTHEEFLAEGDGDPREEFIEALLRALPPAGDILVYYMPFETARLRELADVFPHHASAIDGLITRCKDLIVPFKQGWYYDPAMGTSNSIKAVLPALVPELSYGGMAIADGETASRQFVALLTGAYEGDRSALRADLLAYCGLDTLAMVRILEVLEARSADVKDIAQNFKSRHDPACWWPPS